MRHLLTAALSLGGAIWILIAAIGIVRLPDLLCRAHAVTKAMTLGIFLVLLALWVHTGDEQTALKIALAIFFQVATIPLANHLVALLALQKNLPRWQQRPMDDHRTKARH